MSETVSPTTTLVRPLNAIVLSLAAGLALGILTNLAQGRLPGAWNSLANSGAIWSVAAFAAGASPAARVSLPLAAIAGLCAEAGLVIGYYGFAEFGRDGMGDLFFPLVWLGLAFVAGPIFGVAGQWWRRGPKRRQRVTAVAALAGVFGMESIHYSWNLGYAPQAWACAAVLVLVPLLLSRAREERALSLLVAVAFSLVAYALVALPLGLLSG